MDAEVVNKFLKAASSILTDYFSVSVKSVGDLHVVVSTSALEPVTVIIDLIGDLRGQFLLGFSQDAALKLVRQMMGNSQYPALDDVGMSALAELGNMITGQTSTSLAAMGYTCDMAPPMVATGDEINMQFSVPKLLSLPITTSIGELKIGIALSSSQ